MTETTDNTAGASGAICVPLELTISLRTVAGKWSPTATVAATAAGPRAVSAFVHPPQPAFPPAVAFPPDAAPKPPDAIQQPPCFTPADNTQAGGCVTLSLSIADARSLYEFVRNPRLEVEEDHTTASMRQYVFEQLRGQLARL